jgi:hypothetical protein
MPKKSRARIEKLTAGQDLTNTACVEIRADWDWKKRVPNDPATWPDRVQIECHVDGGLLYAWDRPGMVEKSYLYHHISHADAPPGTVLTYRARTLVGRWAQHWQEVSVEVAG